MLVHLFADFGFGRITFSELVWCVVQLGYVSLCDDSQRETLRLLAQCHNKEYAAALFLPMTEHDRRLFTKATK
jgi:hypothetical protein